MKNKLKQKRHCVLFVKILLAFSYVCNFWGEEEILNTKYEEKERKKIFSRRKSYLISFFIFCSYIHFISFYSNELLIELLPLFLSSQLDAMAHTYELVLKVKSTLSLKIRLHLAFLEGFFLILIPSYIF